jgi:DNA-binding IclR family transcriptional regulator
MSEQGGTEQREENASRGIQSIEIGCEILRVLGAADGPLALKDIAAAVKMAPSKIRFYLVSFIRKKLITQNQLTGRYALGPFAIQLGMAALGQSDLADVSREVMLKLCDETGLTVFLSIWGNRGPVIVSKFEGLNHSPINIRVGYVLPLTSSATGNVFYGCLPSRETMPIMRLERFGAVPVRSRKPKAAEHAELVARIQADGHAISDNQVYEGYTGASAPVFGADGRLEAALTILGPSSMFEPELRKRAMIDLLMASTREISAQIGYQPRESAGVEVPRSR